GYGFSEFQGVGFYVNWLQILDYAIWGTPLILAGSDISSYWETNLYAGMLILLLAFSYIAIRDKKINVRIRKIAVLVILLLCINGKLFNYLMHLFHYTHGIPNRHTVYLMFYMVVLASDTYIYFSGKMKKKDKLALMLISLMTLVLLVAGAVYNGKDRAFNYILSILLILVYTALFIIKKRINMMVWLKILSFVLITEISTSYIIFFNYPYPHVDKDIYASGKLSNYEAAIKTIDTDGYERVTANHPNAPANLGMVLGYNTCAGFSGSASIGYVREMHKLGVKALDQTVNENGFNTFLNAIFSKKYILFTEESIDQNGVECIYDAIPNNGSITNVSDVSIYENNEYISPIVVAKSDFAEYNEFSKNNEYDNSNIAAFNEQLSKALTGIEGFANEEEVAFEIENEDKCEASFEGNKLIIRQGDEVLVKKGIVKTASVEFSFTAPEDGEYMVAAFDNYNLGYFKKGEKVIVKNNIDGRVFSADKKLDFSYDDAGNMFVKKKQTTADVSVLRLDMNKWQEVYQQLKANQMDVEKFEAGYIKGSLNSDSETAVFTTIPYDWSWNIIVDGKKVETKRIGDGFLSFDIDAGKHEVELKYIPKGAYVGIMLSLIFIIINITMMLYYRKGKKTIWLE
nr:YfhO family protein [Lachnospiraceae bacterium]